jgi:hypothetical protein
VQQIQGDYIEPRKSLLRVCLDYIDELNKVRKYACPLSLNMLLSASMESVLNVLVIENSRKASETRAWRRSEKELVKGAVRLVPEIPVFTLAGLIEVVDEIKLLKTRGVQNAVDNLILDSFRIKFPRLLGAEDFIEELRNSLPIDALEAKRNHDLMHTLRGYRNSIHPLQVIQAEKKDGLGDFSLAILNGLRLIVLLEHLLEIAPVVQQSGS